MRRILVNGEPGPLGRQLEQDAARVLEVDRLEPEAVDDRRRAGPARLDLARDGEFMRLVIHAPGEMVHGDRAPAAAALRRRLTDVDDSGGVTKAVARPAVLLPELLEPHPALDERCGRRRVAF